MAPGAASNSNGSAATATVIPAARRSAPERGEFMDIDMGVPPLGSPPARGEMLDPPVPRRPGIW
ncbi:hypothetical protein MINS_30460 [Mycolicibacterium insubricum]|nr:hypothetical protein MINS_30460 [Mycolicibacterium insubricum]